MKEISQKILCDRTGMRLDVFLARRYSGMRRALWQERIRKSKVLVQGRAVRPSHRLKAGDEIHFFFPEREEPPVNSSYSIMYQNEDYCIINKPPDLPVHPAGPYCKHTLLHIFQEKEGIKPHLVSRLDRQTSGCLLLALRPEYARYFFKIRPHMKKEYLVLVEGLFPNRLEAAGFMGQDDRSKVRKKRAFSQLPAYFSQPESCSTSLVREGFLAEKNISLVRARLHTGRTHQIRATLCSLGFPVVGDTLYGKDDGCYLRFVAGELTDADKSMLRLNRTALHSWRLQFPLPDGAPKTFEASLPQDMQELMSSELQLYPARP